TGADAEGFYHEYRTFPDTQARVRGYFVSSEDTELPRRFVVSTKGGRRIEYGTRSEHRIFGRNGIIRQWSIARELDKRRNTVDYLYRSVMNEGEAAGTTREHVISRILYTGHLDESGHYDMPPTREVAFDYIDAPKWTTAQFSKGVPVTRELVLGGIRT